MIIKHLPADSALHREILPDPVGAQYTAGLSEAQIDLLGRIFTLVKAAVAPKAKDSDFSPPVNRFARAQNAAKPKRPGMTRAEIDRRLGWSPSPN